MTATIPEGFHTVTPMLVFKDARRAIEFYKKALGARERFSMPGPDGRGVMHAELAIGNSVIMMGEEHPGEPCKSAETAGGSPVSFYVYVPDADAACRQAVAAGASSRMPVEDMFWGDRMGTVQDPFGYSWSLATHVKDPTEEELAAGAQAFAQRAGKQQP
ncbi:MAG: VOC family protein [Thermodesulfobacteriota bacterium]